MIKDIRKALGIINIPKNSKPPLYLTLQDESNTDLKTLLLENKGYLEYMTKTREMKIEKASNVLDKCIKIKGLSLGKVDFSVYLKGIVKIKDEIGRFTKRK